VLLAELGQSTKLTPANLQLISKVLLLDRVLLHFRNSIEVAVAEMAGAMKKAGG
jgi:hypothetical protein